jgi:hypothetical protein
VRYWLQTDNRPRQAHPWRGHRNTDYKERSTMKLSREELKALRREGAKRPRILGRVVMPHNYNAPIISASFDSWPYRLYTIWDEGDSAGDLRWTEEDPRKEMVPTRKPGLWEWRRSI